MLRRSHTGAAALTGASTPATVNYRVSGKEYVRGGSLSSVDVFMDSEGSPIIYVYDRDGDNFTPVRQTTIGPLSVGEHLALPVNLQVDPGQYVGVYPDGIAAGPGGWLHGMYYGSTPSFTDPDIFTSASSLVIFNVFEPQGITREEFVNNIFPQGVATADDVAAPSAARPYALSTRLYDPVVVYFGGAGQSNAAGQQPAITLRQEYGALSFANGDDTLQPARSPECGAYEFPGLGGAAYLRRRMMGENLFSNIGGGIPTIAGHAAIGATEIAALDKGSPIYQDGLDQLSAALTYAGANSLVHLGQTWFQGERDGFLTTGRAAYYALLVALATDYDADCRALLTAAAQDDSYPLRTAVVQIASAYGSYGEPSWEIAMAQFEACRDERLLVMACPNYVAPFGDSLHATAAGSRRIGGYLLRALMSQCTFEPLWVVDSYVSGNAIVLVYNRDDLQIDTTRIPLQTNYGFRVYDALDAEVTDFTVTVSGFEVTLDCGTDPTGFSWDYGHLEAVGLAPYSGGAGNLRDSAGDTDVWEGWPMHNWAVLQEGAL